MASIESIDNGVWLGLNNSDPKCFIVYKNHPWYHASLSSVQFDFLGSQYDDNKPAAPTPDINVLGLYHTESFKIYSFSSGLPKNLIIEKVSTLSHKAFRSSTYIPDVNSDALENANGKPFDIGAAAVNAANKFIDNELTQQPTSYEKTPTCDGQYEIKKLWNNDRISTGIDTDVGDLNKLMHTIASHPYINMVKEYVKFLGCKKIRISLAKRGQNLNAWLATFRDSGFDASKERIELLMDLWEVLTKRQFEAWATTGIKGHTETPNRKSDLIHEERNMSAHLFEMLDFADKLAEIVPILKSKAQALRRYIQGEIDKIVINNNNNDPSVRSRMYVLNTIWSTIDVELNEEYVRNITGFLKVVPPIMPSEVGDKWTDTAIRLINEREMQLSRLRNIQSMMEKVLDFKVTPINLNDPVELIGRSDVQDVKLHKSQPLHLFTPNTYNKLKQHIIEFSKQSSDVKGGQFYLIRLLFEKAALTEVVRRLLEMIEDVTALGELIRNPRKTYTNEANENNIIIQFKLRCVSLLEDLEWGCTRTWQEEFDHDNNDVHNLLYTEFKTAQGLDNELTKKTWAELITKPWSSIKSYYKGTSGTDSGSNNVTAAQYTKNVVGGAPEMSPSFYDIETSTDPSNIRSKVQLSIDHWKSAARRLFVRLRTALAECTYETVPVANTLVGSFIRDTVNRRLEAFSDKVNIAMKNYLRPSPIDPVENMAVNRALKRQQETARSGYRISVFDGIRFRASEPSVRLLVGLKLMRFVGQIGATWAARRSYSEQYNIDVHVEGRPPPPLTRMLFSFLGIDATLQLITLIGLVISSRIILDHRKYESNVYVIDDYFIQAFLVDYFITTVTLGVLAYIIASLIRKKTYFHLAEDGQRAANAYGWSLIGISGVIAVIPPLSL